MREPPERNGSWRESLPVHLTMIALISITAGFHLRLEMPLLDAIFVTLLLVGLPVLSLAQLPLLAGQTIERSAAYAGSAITIGVLGSIALVLGGLGPGLAAMGLGPVEPRALAATGGALAGGALVLMGVFHLLERFGGFGETALLRQLIPRTGPERGVFVGLSFVAGLGEEVAYRGYLLALLVPAFGDPWVAVAVSSTSFGLLHAYQGAVGIVRTGSLGALFAASFVVTGTLWPAIVVHTIVDLVGGLWLGPRLLRER